MSNRRILAIAAGLILAACSRGKKPECTGTVSGAVDANFDCKVGFVQRGDGSVRVYITPDKMPSALAAFEPGELEVPAPVETKSYSLATLSRGMTILTSSKHATYLARKDPKNPKDAKGDMTLKLESVKMGAHGTANEEDPVLKGSLEARLVPASPAPNGGEVVVKLKF